MCRPIHCGTCGVTRAMSHHLEGEAKSPGAQRQSIPVKGRKTGQHSAGDGRYSQKGGPRDMEMQGVRLDMSKIKGIRARSRADQPLSEVR